MPSVIYHPAYQKYAFGEDHPFSPVRVEMTLDLLHALGHDVRVVAPELASRADLLSVHEEYYVRRVEDLSVGLAVPDREDYGLDTPDNPAFLGMGEAARWLVGGTLCGARLICEKGQKRVLQLYYFGDKGLKEIGEELGVGEARVSQIHKQAVIELRRMIAANKRAVAPSVSTMIQ